jgi:hypothetical protein
MLRGLCNNGQKEILHKIKILCTTPQKGEGKRRNDIRRIGMSATAAFNPDESSEEDTTDCPVFLVYLFAGENSGETTEFPRKK